MFNRTLLSFFGLLSLAWIAYVGITLVNSSVIPKPEKVFSEQDGNVVVVHKTTEIDYTQPAFQFIQKVPFYLQLLDKTERIQHYYFSEKRALVVLERSKPWNFELIQKYFGKLGYGVTIKNAKEISISNQWKGKYHDNYLVLYTEKWQPTETSIINWAFIDRKSSASVISKISGTYQIENCYLISENQVRYISRNNRQALPLVDDQEIFQDVIPAKFDSYTFYEKNYLKRQTNHTSPILEWINYGMVILSANNETAFITDFIPGQDPIAILSSFIDESDGYSNEKRATISNCKLPFDELLSNSWEVEVFNNRVFIAANKRTINELIGNYETGNTLAQATSTRAKLFENTPKRVSLRSINATEHVTQSCLSQSQHTVIHTFSKETNEAEQNELAAALTPLRLDNSVRNILPIQGTNGLYVITNSNTLSYVSNEQLLWTKELNDEVVGEPIIQSNSSNIIITTRSGLHVFTVGGSELAGFPMNFASVACSPTIFTWKSKLQMAFIANGMLNTVDFSGKRLQTCSINVNSSSDVALCIEAVKGELMGHVVQNGNWSKYNINRKRKMNQRAIGAGEWYLVKNGGKVTAMGLSNKQLVRVAESGQKVVLIGNVSHLLRHFSNDSEELFYLSQQQRIYVITGTGAVLAQFETRVKGIEDAYLLRSSKGKTLVGILDGISNNSYIYTLNGNELGKQLFEGSGKIVLHKRNDGVITLVSQSNSYLVRYPLNY